MAALAAQWRAFLPTIARSGHYFRTVAFQHEMAPDMQVHLEAVEHPMTNLWQVSEVTTRPNTLSVNPPVIEDRRAERGQESVSLVQALETLAKYEIAQLAMQLTAVGKTGKDLGNDHVRAFAERESCKLDIHGNVHPIVGGRIVTDGVFEQGAHAKQYKTAAANDPVYSAQRLDLSHLFRTNGKVDDFTRLLDLQMDQRKWQDFQDEMTNVLRKLINIQDNDYKTKEEGISYTLGFVRRDDVVDGRADLTRGIDNCRRLMPGFTFMTAAHREMCSNFFREIEVCYEVGYAKILYKRMQSAGAEAAITEARAKLEKQVARASAVCLQMGGNESDIQRIKAEAINGIEDRSVNMSERIQRLGGKNIGAGFSRNSDYYFIPDSVITPLIALEKLGDEVLKRAIEQEKARIHGKATKPAASDQPVTEAPRRRGGSKDLI